MKRPSQRLKETVLKHNLATPLAALMAQQRDCIIYKETVSLEHIKLVGKVYDQVYTSVPLEFGLLQNDLYCKILTTKATVR